MSNLGQFYGKGFPLGASVTMVYQGDKFTATDGSEWVFNSPTHPFSYTSSYANLPESMLCSQPLINGPYSGLWLVSSTGSLAYKAADTLYCTGNYGTTATEVEGDSTNGFIYYTSSNAGVTWVRRTFPNNKNYFVSYTAGLFVGLAVSSTTNAVITSADAVTWSSLTGASQTTVGDIVSDGSTQIVVYPRSGTVANYSTDSGATWASATITAPSLGNFGSAGGCTWNAGAGLFIGNVGTSGQYQTSPTGQTWTLRNTQATFQPYGNASFFGTTCKFASNATTTIAVGVTGFFATTTDGLTWSNHGFISSIVPLGVGYVFYDGTRFVVVAADRTFYSTDGISWTEGMRVPTANINVLVSNGRHVRSGAATLAKAFLVTDPTLTTPQIVTAGNMNSNTYYRIK